MQSSVTFTAEVLLFIIQFTEKSVTYHLKINAFAKRSRVGIINAISGLVPGLIGRCIITEMFENCNNFEE